MDMNSRDIDANGTIHPHGAILFKRISQEASESEDGSTILAAEAVARRSHGAIQQDNEEFADGRRSHTKSEI